MPRKSGGLVGCIIWGGGAGIGALTLVPPPGRLLQRLLRFHYLDDSLLSRLPPGVLSTLKITALHDGHLLDLVEQLLKLGGAGPLLDFGTVSTCDPWGNFAA